MTAVSPFDSTNAWSPFAILEHDYPFLHWDLLLQQGDVLKTWRLLQPVTPGTWIAAEQLSDHRLHYLTYEGPVSGNRGSVFRVTSGKFRPVECPTADVDAFDLADCPLATRAFCRSKVESQPEWSFE